MQTERTDLFFKEQLDRVFARERISVSESAQAHLTGVLVRPASHDGVAVRTLNQTLASRFAAAFGESVASRTDLLVGVGDDALILRGFWWQHVERPRRTAVDAAYYTDIGRQAYLSVRWSVFDELGNRFEELSHALAMLWAHTHVRSEDDLVTLYRFWLNTRSRYARIILERHGIPVREVGYGH